MIVEWLLLILIFLVVVKMIQIDWKTDSLQRQIDLQWRRIDDLRGANLPYISPEAAREIIRRNYGD